MFDIKEAKMLIQISMLESKKGDPEKRPLSRKQRLKLIKQIARRRGMLKTTGSNAPRRNK